MAEITHKPIVILVRDGWGKNPHPEWNHANAVHLARTPVDDRLMANYPHVLIHTSGVDVGLPDGVMGNSEVGHQNIGAGRIVEQEIMRITGRIHDGSFFTNPALVGAFEHAEKTGGCVHFMGLCSDGRVHSDLEHLYALYDMSVKLSFPGNRVHTHAFMDGRDTPPHAGIDFLRQIEHKCKNCGTNLIASVIGRFYAMDRDNRWDRVRMAYQMLVHGEGARFPSALNALQHYYDNPSEPSKQGDEFVLPSIVALDNQVPAVIRNGDSVIFFNYRGDRPREITKAFVNEQFPYKDEKSSKLLGFDRDPKLDLHFVSMTAYEQGLNTQVAFTKPPKMVDILGSYIADHGLKQFRCAETEKYPHVTFFFNDYRDEPFHDETRAMAPSPREVSTYDQKPQMSARDITREMLQRISGEDDDLIVVNFANGDMVGHTGNLPAAIEAVEVVDECVGSIVDAVLAKGGGVIVTADHGNCEQMIDPATGNPHTAHTTYDVELIVADPRYASSSLKTDGRLADIAPTALHMLGLKQPPTMTGQCLIQ